VDIKDIKIEDYNYSLPDEKIARFPLEFRDRSKLLVYRNKNISEGSFINLADYIDENSLIVFNNTRVIHARLEFRRDTGSQIEILCLEPSQPADYSGMFKKTGECQWWCMVGNLKKWKKDFLEKQVNTREGKVTLSAKKIENNENATLVKFTWNAEISFSELLEDAGLIPIPPYLNRHAVPEDNIWYQTVYSKTEGSVAAPTAGLHFTEAVFDSIKKKGIESAFLTLHVGAGTFRPVKSDLITDHEMHPEHFSINSSSLEGIIRKRGKLIAVGTTSVRTIESLYWLGVKTIIDPDIKTDDLFLNQWEIYDATIEVPGLVALESLRKWMKKNTCDFLQSSTKIMIIPGYKFRLVEAIITNFHQPQSTLLLLISAWVGEDWKKIYKFAIYNNFRFLSYGDSSILYK
jgi:S-adenosylmethionine:tRNA ribosyltransferase-isomerase